MFMLGWISRLIPCGTPVSKFRWPICSYHARKIMASKFDTTYGSCRPPSLKKDNGIFGLTTGDYMCMIGIVASSV